MAAVVSCTEAARAWMFSATTSLVAAISRIDEEDSSALPASTSTLSAIPLRLVIISPMDTEVSTARSETVPAPCETAAPVWPIRSMTAAMPPETVWTRESVPARVSPIRLSESASPPSSSSPPRAARALRSDSLMRRATALIWMSGDSTSREMKK